MAVKIRLKRMGKKKQPVYRVVVADARTPRDGRYIESIGRYDARQEPSLVEIDNDRALHWLQRGAQPTDRARKLLEISGAWARFKVAKGEIHTVGADAKAPKGGEKATDETPTSTPEAETSEAAAADTAPDAEASEAPAEDGGDEKADA